MRNITKCWPFKHCKCTDKPNRNLAPSAIFSEIPMQYKSTHVVQQSVEPKVGKRWIGWISICVRPFLLLRSQLVDLLLSNGHIGKLLFDQWVMPLISVFQQERVQTVRIQWHNGLDSSIHLACVKGGGRDPFFPASCTKKEQPCTPKLIPLASVPHGPLRGFRCWGGFYDRVTAVIGCQWSHDQNATDRCLRSFSRQ